MTFGSPWFLLGALGAGLPVLMHLYGRRRARRVPFPSLLLLRRAERERSSLLRLRQLWLMLLRALLVVLVSLALAQPVVRGLRVPGLPGTPVVFLLDHSLSMAADTVPGGASAALRAMRAVQAALPATQEYGYCLLPAPEGSTPPLSLGRGAALPAALTALPAPPTGPVDLAAALDAVGPVLASARLQEARLVLLTDLQASAWRSAVSGLPAGQDLLVVDCGAEGANAALTGLEVVEPPALVNRPLRLRVTVRQWPPSAAPVVLPVRVRINDGALPAAPCRLVRGCGEVLVEWTPTRPGPLDVRATLPRDRLAADNTATLRLDARRQLRVGLLGDAASTRWLRLALAPRADGPVRVSDVPAATGFGGDALVVTAATGAGLREYVTGGGGLLLFAAGLAADTLTALGGPGAPQLGPLKRPAEPVRLGSFDSFEPPLRAFVNAAAGDLQAPEFRTYRALTVPPGSPWRVLARFGEETPALLSARLGQGRIVLANFAPEPEASTLAAEPVCVPLLHRLVAYVARPGAGDVPAACADPLESDLRRLGPAELPRRLQPLRATLCRPEAAAARLPAALSLATPCWFLALVLLGLELWLLTAGLAPGRPVPGAKERQDEHLRGS